MLPDKFSVEIEYKNTQALLTSSAKFWEEMHSLPTAHVPDFFSHPDALHSWITMAPNDAKFVVSKLKHGGETKGVALFSLYFRRLGVLGSEKTLTLLRSGNPEIDKIWPEYVQPRCEKNLEHLTQAWWQETLKLTNCHLLEVKSIPAKWVVLAGDGHPSQVWLERVCKSSAIQLSGALSWTSSIRRQNRQTEQYADTHLGGCLQLEEVSPSNYQRVLEQHQQWHIGKWANTQTPSALTSPYFTRWLYRLLARTAAPMAKMYRAYTREQTVGICIILDSKPWAGFYLASLLPQPSNHWHIGTWLHCRIAELLKSSGDYLLYDFMDGESEYKSILGNHSTCFVDATWFNKNHWRSQLQIWLIQALKRGSIINN